jgi:hypothetical protein
MDSIARTLLAGGDDAAARHAMANCYLELAYTAYPHYPDVTQKALERVREMGGTDRVPKFGTWRGNLLNRLIGWKATKRLSVLYHSCRPRTRSAPPGRVRRG